MGILSSHYDFYFRLFMPPILWQELTSVLGSIVFQCGGTDVPCLAYLEHSVKNVHVIIRFLCIGTVQLLGSFMLFSLSLECLKWRLTKGLNALWRNHQKQSNWSMSGKFINVQRMNRKKFTLLQSQICRQFTFYRLLLVIFIGYCGSHGSAQLGSIGFRKVLRGWVSATTARGFDSGLSLLRANTGLRTWATPWEHCSVTGNPPEWTRDSISQRLMGIESPQGLATVC